MSPQKNESIANIEAEGDSSSEEDAESSEIVGKTTSLASTKGLTKAQKELIIKQLCPGLAKRQRIGELEVNEACKRSVDFKKLYDVLKLRVLAKCLAKNYPKCQQCRNAALLACKIFIQLFSKLFAGKRLKAETTENPEDKEGEDDKSQNSDDAADESQPVVSIILQLQYNTIRFITNLYVMLNILRYVSLC